MMGRRQSLSRLMKPEHVRATRMLGYALTATGFGAWERFSILIALRLTRQERAALAWSALRSLDPDAAAEVVSTVLVGEVEAA